MNATRRSAGRAAITVALLSIAAATHGAVVSGRVTDGSGTGIPDVDIDFIDRDSGDSIPLTNDDTDFLGFYAVTVPNGDYDVRFEPAPGVRFVAFEERGFKVENATESLDQTLETGWFLSGRVLQEGGAAVVDVDLDFVDIENGPMFVANDRTDGSGDFSVVVPPGSFQIEIEPAAGSLLVPTRVDGVQVVADTSIGEVTVPLGALLSGVIRDFGGGPLASVLVRPLDATGQEVFALRNSTDQLGQYSFVVARTRHDLLLVPPRGDHNLPRLIGGVEVSGTTILPDITLDRGSLITGNVRGPGSVPAEGTDLDFDETSAGIPRLTPRDNADDAGDFAVAVPPGTYDVDFTPPGPSGWAPHRIAAASLLSDTSLPTVQLQPGNAVSGTVRDASGTPLPGVDLDFNPGGGDEIYTDNDNSNASGTFSTLVPAGTYDIVFSPVAGSGVGQVVLPSVQISADVSLGTITLPSSFNPTVTSITPDVGGSEGGAAVTIVGADFAPGVEARLGGRRVTDLVRVNASTLQGIVPVHPAGPVDVVVTNPGSAASSLSEGFTFLSPVDDPVLSVDRGGPLGTDVQLSWTSNGNASYTIFRTTLPSGFVDAAAPLDVVPGTSYRDDAAAAPGRPAAFYYIVQ